MENQKPFKIIISGAETFLQYKDLNTNKIISINAFKNIIKLENQDILEKSVIYKVFDAYAILGIINIKNLNYVLYVKTCKIVGRIRNEIIYRIEEVDFCPMQNIELMSTEEKKLNQLKDGIANLLTLGFYYSFGYNLTNSQQNIYKISYNLKKVNSNLIPNNQSTIEQKLKYIYKTINKKYFFNNNLYQRFINYETKEPYDFTYNFIIPIICGYVGMFDYTINGKQIQFILITRRSQNYAGTRYNTRGINDDGNVANYCESEHIIIANDKLFSYCQLRGSAPVFFDQLGITAYTDITRDKNFAIEAFNKHLKEINEDFKLIYFVNLLNQKKTGEAPIIAEFEKQIKFIQDNNNIRYTFFDMQNECQKDDYSRIDNLMYTISPIVSLFSFFSKDINSDEIFSVQKGTIRTNCLDCLDRTNVIQTRICWLIIENMFKFMNLDYKYLTKIFNTEEKFFIPGNNEFKEKFKNIWAENGDEISIQYTGTASTITTVTKSGGHGFMGLIQHGIATVTRLYKGNFEDNDKQECIDILLQKDLINKEYLNPDISYKLLSLKKEYTQYKDFHIFIGNFNLSGKSIDNAIDIVNWLTSYKENPLDKKNNNNLKDISPEFYILGFEEIVDLNSAHLLIKSNTEKKNNIKTLINNLLLTSFQTQKNDPYQLMKELDLVGLYLLIFVKTSCIKNIKNFDYQIIKTGLKGTLGNKGSLLLRFNLYDTNIAIACSHLSSGQLKNDERKEEIINVLNSSFKKYPSIKFKEYNYYFYFGDINTRLNLTLDNPELIELIKYHSEDRNTVFDSLLKYDQFYQYQKENTVIAEMEEAKINFSPSYKYIIGTTQYDINNRIPSWCDRIFYKKYSETKPLSYNKCILTISDHQPIYGLYKITAEIINHEKRQKILDEIIKEKNKEKSNTKNGLNDEDFRNQQFNKNDIIDNFFSPK